MHSIIVLEKRMQRRRVQTPYLGVRLQADSPVYSILNCDAWTHTQGIWYFAKVAPVDLKQILEDEAETAVRKNSCCEWTFGITLKHAGIYW